MADELTAAARLLMVPIHEVAAHPRLALAMTFVRARRKYRAEMLRQAFRDIGREDPMGVGRVLAVLSRQWVEG